MTHHHNHPSSTAPPIQRPIYLRLLSILALLIPPILYIISLGLTLAIQYNEHYALVHVYDTEGVQLNGTVAASPFYTCVSPPTTALDDISQLNRTCHRKPLIGKGALKTCYERYRDGAWDDTQLCQKVVSSAGLYVAGAVLVGLAALFAILLVVFGFKQAWAKEEAAPGYAYMALQHGEHQSPPHSKLLAAHSQEPAAHPTATSPYTPFKIGTAALFSFTTLLALLAAICILLGQILGVQSLVNEQIPTAGTDLSMSVIGHWYMGTPALVWSSVAWLSAIIGVFTAVAGRVSSRI